MKKLTAPERTALRERGYADGLIGRARRSDNPEYLTSYRRGAEARRREQEWNEAQR